MHILTGKKRRAALVPVLAAAMAAGACKDINVPDYNRAGVGDLENNPNATLINAASLGMLASARLDAHLRVRLVAITGREGYYLDTSEPRYVTELVGGQIDPSAFSGNHNFLNPYGTIAQGYILLRAIDKVSTAEYSDPQKQALRGFVKTIMASEFMAIGALHQYAPVDVDRDPLGEPAPMVPKAQVFAKAAQLLDEAAVHLKAGSATFPSGLTLPSGFTQFSTAAGNLNAPAGGFLKFNRGLRARLDIWQGNYAAALAHVDSSFVNPTGVMNAGVYYTYGTGSGDRPNPLGSGAAPEGRVDSAIVANAQLQPGGAKDARLLAKVELGPTRSQLGINSYARFKNYTTAPYYGQGGEASPIPWLRNEELILIRAEARWFTGDKPGAMSDLNAVRTASGGLTAIAQPATDAAFIDALFYERTYSLLYEGGFRWLDMVRFGKLGLATDYPRAGDKAISFFPIPFNECLARGGAGSAPGC